MKLTIEREALLNALTIVAPRAKASTDIAAWKHLLLNVAHGTLTLSGNDMTACCSVTIGADVESVGDLAAPAAEFRALVSRLPKGAQIQLTQDGPLLEIKCGRSKYDLPTLPVADMPALLEVQNNHPVDVTGADIVTLFQRPACCVCADQTRYYLAGIYLHAVDGKLAACATDACNLLRFITAQAVNGIDNIIVPTSILPELVKVGSDGGKLSWSGRLLTLSTPAVTLTTRLVEGTFPEYTRVIPAESEGHIDLDREEFIAACERLMIVGEKTLVTMQWEDDPTTVRLSVGARGEEFIDCASEQMVAGSVRIFPKRTPIVLAELKGEMIRLTNLKVAENNAGAIRITDKSEPDVIALSMPGIHGKEA
jgi:DNA polymerase-3 subunit beta